jgi:hypothetical protein
MLGLAYALRSKRTAVLLVLEPTVIRVQLLSHRLKT